jgi:adenylate cyclase
MSPSKPGSRTGHSFQILLICLGVGVLAILIGWNGWFENLEMKTVDARFRFRHWLKEKRKERVPVSDQVVLIGIDQKSVDPAVSEHADRWGTGGWFTRDHWRHSVENLIRFAKPSVVAFDIIFLPFRKDKKSENADVIDEMIRKERQPFKALIQDERFPRNQLLYQLDEAGNNKFFSLFLDLADKRSDGQKVPFFITAYNFTGGILDSAESWKLEEKEDKERIETLHDQAKNQAIPFGCIRNIPADYPYAGNVSLPFLDLASAPVHLGFINVPRDPDGNLRRVPLVWGYRDPMANNQPVFMPAMALQACMLHLGILSDPAADLARPGTSGVTVDFGKEIHLWNSAGRNIRIPIDRYGRLFLNFEGTIGDFAEVPFVDTIRYGNSDEVCKALANRIALVGTTFTGGTDVGPCAVDPNTPFVFIHMTAVDNILRGIFLRPIGRAEEALLLGLLLFAIWYLGTHCTARVAGLGTAVMLAGTEGAAYGLFHFNVTCLPMVLPALTVLVAFGAVALYRYETEQKARLEIRKKFSAMVSDVVLHYLEEHPDSFSLAGERREATIFFSDVAGFTSISEKLTPAQLVEVLNAYLGPMSDIIKAHRGCVNKFAGDGIMAFWGAPFPSTDHAAQACLAALEQQRRIREIAPKFREMCGTDLNVRMGINTGVVSAGGMGSLDRREYTVMGDTVNFAARLEPTNKDYSTRILIGAQTYVEAKGQIVARQLDKIVVKGKTEPVAIYELVGKEGEVPLQMLEGIQLFEQALALYWKREWVKALELFEAVNRQLGGDRASQVFIERTKHYQIEPPPPEWQGEYVRTKKD